MLIIIAYILWYLFHLFCSGWIHDWVTSRSGVSEAELKAFIAQQETKGQEGKSKLEAFFNEPQPTQRQIRRWCASHSADPALYKQSLWISRIAELPAIVFGIRCLLAIIEFWGISSVPAGWYIAVIVYDLILLLLGIRWRRSTP